MDRLLYLLARGLIAVVQALPLTWVACLGRGGGWLAHTLDGRHRRIARRNLTLCFGKDKPAAEIRALAKENFRRIGESFACAAKTMSMSAKAIRARLEVVGVEKLQARLEAEPNANLIAALGHFGNFELYARVDQFLPGFQFATTYRGLRQPALNRLLQDLRQRSGCLFFERRTEAEALKARLRRGNVLLGFLADQHAGDRGVNVPFFGRDCSTTAAPAVFARRYACPLHPVFCFRVAPGRWRIEVGDEIPTREHGQPRSVAAITLDINRAFEAAVRRDPANWFWVHNRWKPKRSERRRAASAPSPLEAQTGA